MVKKERIFSLKDGKKIPKTVLAAATNAELSVLAAGIAYFATLSFFPMLMVTVSVTALFVRPESVQQSFNELSVFLPQDIAGLVSAQLNNLAGRPSASIFSAIIGVLLAIYGMSGVIDNLIKAINIAYGVKETRNFLKLKLMSLGMTIMLLLVGFLVVPAMSMTSGILEFLGLPPLLANIIISGRWLVLVMLLSLGLSILYNFGPSLKKRPKWTWINWGTITGTALWLLATIAFFIYARYFGNFSNSYSLFAGIIVLMIWFNLSATAWLIGAKVHASLKN